MSETLNSPQNQERIDPALAAEWVQYADQIAPFDQSTTINRGNGPETFVLKDALSVQQKDESGSIIGRVPSVVLAREDGTTETLKAEDFLTFVGADSFGLKRIINEAKPASTETIDRRLAQYEGSQIAALVLDKSVEASPTPTYEEREEQRLRALYAPVVSKDADVSKTEADYDYLFDPNYEPRNRTVAAAAHHQIKGREHITDVNRQKARDILDTVVTQPLVQQILLQVTGKSPKADMETVDAIRTDPELRYQLGKHFTDKMWTLMHKMPERIQDNTEKSSISYGGYDRSLKSREYAVLLALSMLDGSFNYSQEQRLYDFNEQGIATIGQHRAAARTLLGIPVNQ